MYQPLPRPVPYHIANEIAIFAERFGISLEVAGLLPAVFETFAKSVDLPVRQMIATATYSNPGLAAYVKEIALQVYADEVAQS